MRNQAAQMNDLSRMQAWAGQAARLAQPRPAGEVAQTLWAEAQALF
jgi:nitronate monooxygenase